MKSSVSQFVKIFQQLNYILDKKQKQKAVFVLGIVILSSVFELLGVTAVLPFIQAALTPDILMQNSIVQKILRMLSLESARDLLILAGCALIMLYLVKNGFMIFSQFVQADYATYVQRELSVKMLSSYMKRPYSYFLDANSSEILRGCQGDIDSVYTVLSSLLTIFAECLSITMISLFVVWTELFTAIGVLLLMLAVLFGIFVEFKPVLKKAGKNYMGAYTQKNKIIYQTVSGIKEIFVMQRKDFFLKDYEDASDQARKSRRLSETLSNVPDRIIEAVCVGGIIAVVCLRLCISRVDVMEFVPKMGVFAMAAFKIFPSIGKLANRMSGIMFNMVGFNNVYCIMQEAEYYEKEFFRYAASKTTGYSESLNDERQPEFKEKVSVDHVWWQYEKTEQPVLKDVCLDIKKGESIAFIGMSGSGKTTLSDVILGLLHPQSGSVEMDGRDVFAIPKDWSKLVGYVPQVVFLLDDTVRKNVAFGVFEEQIDDKDIWNALERAQLADFIHSLPNGLDTVVGERGIKFSGGQRQRIAIARALYNKPEILILDEATASLDHETEMAVMESIDALMGQITMIIVAHRLATIRNCDRIYEITDGIAVERRKEEALASV